MTSKWTPTCAALTRSGSLNEDGSRLRLETQAVCPPEEDDHQEDHEK
jgi:hypothetical protein